MTIVDEIGSGLNGHRKKLIKLLSDPSVSTILVEHRDRLARFGVEYMEAALLSQGRSIIVADETEETSDIWQDFRDLVTSMCARIYGKRGARNRAEKALEAVRETDGQKGLQDRAKADQVPAPERPACAGVEDLNVSGMMKDHRLARSVADASMREFRRQMEYKCAWCGIELVIVPRFEATSKPCSRCGWIKTDLSLADRTFRCVACGHVADRDENASDNIRKLAVSSTERINGRGEDTARAPSVKRQLKLAG